MTANSDLKELRGRDPHTVLGVRRGVSQQEVIKAFRRRAARGAHPDIGGDDTTFRQIARARDVLLDQRRLTEYDAARQAAATMHVRTHHSRRRDAAPESFRPRDPHAPPEPPEPPRPAGAGTTRAETRAPSVAATPESTNPWAIITVLLVLLGPLLWPAAIATGHLAVWRARRAGNGGDSRVSGALATFFVLSILVLPALVLVAVIMLT